MSTDYFLVTRQSVFELNREVNTRLRNGWELCGPTFMGFREEYCQTMVRHAKEKQTTDSWRDLVEISTLQRYKNNQEELPKDWENS